MCRMPTRRSRHGAKVSRATTHGEAELHARNAPDAHPVPQPLRKILAGSVCGSRLRDGTAVAKKWKPRPV